MRVWFIILVTSLSFGFAQHNMSNMTMEGQNLSDLEAEAFEIAFMSAMVSHHEGAIEMAQWIIDRSELPSITSSAKLILEAQEPEIKLMKSWLDEWYEGRSDIKASAMMAADMQTMMTNMEELDNPDVAFLSQMSLHHDSAIDMAQLALFKATHPKLRELAKIIIVNQAQEIATFQETLRELQAR